MQLSHGEGLKCVVLGAQVPVLGAPYNTDGESFHSWERCAGFVSFDFSSAFPTRLINREGPDVG